MGKKLHYPEGGNVDGTSAFSTIFIFTNISNLKNKFFSGYHALNANNVSLLDKYLLTIVGAYVAIFLNAYSTDYQSLGFAAILVAIFLTLFGISAFSSGKLRYVISLLSFLVTFLVFINFLTFTLQPVSPKVIVSVFLMNFPQVYLIFRSALSTVTLDRRIALALGRVER